MNPLKSPVKDRGVPPDSFLTELVAWGKTAPDEIFEPNTETHDVMPLLRPLLGPWQGLIHRRAAMLELLRCLAGFESSWNWSEGVDRANKTSMANIEGQETGIFQVSHDSLNLDKNGTLKAWLNTRLQTAVHDPREFIDAMKSYHTFALEYCARLLRVSYRWDGPILSGEINSSLSRAAVEEFQRQVK